jgi:membrane AbrB-like protein
MQNNQAIPFNKENFKQILSKEFMLVIFMSVPAALIGSYFNVPLAWFLGPMIVTCVASFNGIQTKIPELVRSVTLIMLGLYIGNYIDRSLFSQIHQWAWTSLVMLFYIIASVLLVSKYLQKFSGYDKKTSIFSAAPGALGPLLILAEDEKSDLSQVATSHLIRLMIIVTAFPLLVNGFYDFEIAANTETVIKDQNINHLLILVIVSVILILFFDKFKIPAVLISGPLIVSGFFQVTEIASYKIGPDIINFCLLILGASVGCRFAGKTFNEISKSAFHSFVATFFLITLGLIAAFVASLFIEKNFFTLLLSYCPGGIYEVAVIAIFFDLDPEFVAYHHIIRLLMILFMVPVLLKLVSKKK